MHRVSKYYRAEAVSTSVIWVVLLVKALRWCFTPIQVSQKPTQSHHSWTASPALPLQILFSKMAIPSMPQLFFAVLVCYIHNLWFWQCSRGYKFSTLVAKAMTFLCLITSWAFSCLSCACCLRLLRCKELPVITNGASERSSSRSLFFFFAYLEREADQFLIRVNIRLIPSCGLPRTCRYSIAVHILLSLATWVASCRNGKWIASLSSWNSSGLKRELSDCLVCVLGLSPWVSAPHAVVFLWWVPTLGHSSIVLQVQLPTYQMNLVNWQVNVQISLPRLPHCRSLWLPQKSLSYSLCVCLLTPHPWASLKTAFALAAIW